MTVSSSIGQRGRLITLVLYVAGLLAASRAAFGTWIPPTSEQGLWFYAALAALLLGSLLVTPFFTKPADAISYSTVFGLRVFDATGMEFLKNYLGEDYAGVLSTLEDRHAVVFGRASSCRDPVLTRLNDRDEFLGVFRGPVPAVREAEAQA